MRYLLVGEAPARDPGKTGLDFMLACKAAGVPLRRGAPGKLRALHRDLFWFYRQTTHVNLISRWPGFSGRGSAFPAGLGQVSARTLLRVLEDAAEREHLGEDVACMFGEKMFPVPRVVLFAGRRVARAFGVPPRRRYFESVPMPGLPLQVTCVVPHPSGVNKWWNDPSNCEHARDILSLLGASARE